MIKGQQHESECWNFLVSVHSKLISKIFNLFWNVFLYLNSGKLGFCVDSVKVIYWFFAESSWDPARKIMMNSSVSDHSFYIESDEEDEEKEFNKGEEEDGNDSDSSNSSNENQQQRKPSSHNTSWPQSYRLILFLPCLFFFRFFNFQAGWCMPFFGQ